MTDKAGENRKPEDTALSDQAIAQLVHLRSGRATDADRDAFASWRRISPDHEGAAREAESLWSDLAATDAAAAHLAAAPSNERTRDRPRVRRPEGRGDGTGRRRPAVFGRAAVFGGVAALCVLAVAGAGTFGPVSGVFADHATGRGERLDLRLPDGSTALLSGATAVSLDYTADARRLRLHEGEALFTVSPDAARPFVVATEEGEAVAVGTVFAVRRDRRHVGVVVAEGAVDLRPSEDPGGSLRLSANQGASLDSRGLSAPQAIDATAATAWARGKLIFNRSPLAEVAAEIERYHGIRIVILDDGLKDLQVSGIFDLDRPDAILSTLELTLEVDVVRLPLVTFIR